MKRRILFAVAAVFLTLTSFQNCSLVNSSHTDMASMGKSCLSTAENAFKSTYYPHLRSQCASCHDNGGQGISWFASSDSNFAFTAFMNTTREKINSMMVYDGHPGPNNGPNQESFVASMAAQWSVIDKQIDGCIHATAITTIGKNTPVQEVAVSDPANVDSNRRPWRVLEFDLFSDLAESSKNGLIHMVVRIQYRESGAGTGTPVQYNSDLGYEFRRPTARIRAGSPANTRYAVDKISVLLNGKKIPSVTSFEAINDVGVTSATDTSLIEAGASVGVVSPKNLSTDLIQIRFAEIRDGNGSSVGTPNTPGTPTGPTVPARVTFAQLMDGNGTYGYFARSCVSCHSAGNAQGSLDITNYAAASLVAASIKSRVNNGNNPMPRAGLLPQFERDVISKWVDIGAPQN